MDNKFQVIRDTREKCGFGYIFEEDAYCSGTIKRKLQYGDYSVDGLEDILSIERKESVAEIAKNYTEKRFWREVEALSKMEHAFFVFEFSWNDISRFPNNLKLPPKVKANIKVTSTFLLSKTLSITTDFGIPVYFCGDRYAAQSTAYMLLGKIYKKCKKKC